MPKKDRPQMEKRELATPGYARPRSYCERTRRVSRRRRRHGGQGEIEWARGAMLAFDPPLFNPEDITIPVCVPGADEAIALIRRHHEVWLSTQKFFQRV